MQRGSPAISPFAAIGNIEKFDLTTSFFSNLLEHKRAKRRLQLTVALFYSCLVLVSGCAEVATGWQKWFHKKLLARTKPVAREITTIVQRQQS
jgi:hypothetical protein